MNELTKLCDEGKGRCNVVIGDLGEDRDWIKLFEIDSVCLEDDTILINKDVHNFKDVLVK